MPENNLRQADVPVGAKTIDQVQGTAPGLICPLGNKVIYAVPGVDAVFVGPNDLSFSMKAADGSPPNKDVFEATLTRIREAAHRQKLPCGLHVFSAADALKRASEGWQFIAVNSELKMMLDGAAQVARQVNPEHAAAGLAKY